MNVVSQLFSQWTNKGGWIGTSVPLWRMRKKALQRAKRNCRIRFDEDARRPKRFTRLEPFSARSICGANCPLPSKPSLKLAKEEARPFEHDLGKDMKIMRKHHQSHGNFTRLFKDELDSSIVLSETLVRKHMMNEEVMMRGGRKASWKE